ncbi:hypothetical protein GGE65_007679 [Skermanella aerolata]|uniref:hypothetical protein n=1 Tax=Skermanella aerolata TaxID=393310 RepID=UPI003D1DCA34
MACEKCTEWQAKFIRSEERRLKDQIEYRANSVAEKYGVAPSAREDLHARILGMGDWKDENGKLVLMKGGLAARTRDEDVITPEVAVRLLKTEAPHLFGDVPEKDGTGGPNPWAASTWNLTEQGRILQRDPAQARKLAAAAGAKLPAMAE